MDLTQDSGEGFLSHLETIGAEDAVGLKKAYESYGPSWKSRGGVGAFMMLARKWDRMENRVRGGARRVLPSDLDDYLGTVKALKGSHALPGDYKATGELLERMLKTLTGGGNPYDIFWHIANDPRAEGVIDDVRDLRRYLMLVEAEMRARGFDATHRDNKPDSKLLARPVGSDPLWLVYARRHEGVCGVSRLVSGFAELTGTVIELLGVDSPEAREALGRDLTDERSWGNNADMRYFRYRHVTSDTTLEVTRAA